MKKIAIFALVCAVGVSMAFASSIKVPWFVDNAPAPTTGLPPSAGIATIVYLTSNSDSVVDCTIAYYTAAGVFVGPADDGVSNTFSIAPRSSLAFRPVQSDSSANGGQENEASGWLVPDRPLTGAGNDGKKNGSCVIEWTGGSSLVQGQVTSWDSKQFGYAHLLPAGAGGGVSK